MSAPHPFEWYAERYNLKKGSKKRPFMRFTKESWDSLMQYSKKEADRDEVVHILPIIEQYARDYAIAELERLKDWRYGKNIIMGLDELEEAIARIRGEQPNDTP